MAADSRTINIINEYDVHYSHSSSCQRSCDLVVDHERIAKCYHVQMCTRYQRIRRYVKILFRTTVSSNAIRYYGDCRTYDVTL